MEVFKGNFTQQEAMDADTIKAATDILQTGRLHRYNLLPGELGETSLLEQEFAAFTGAKYCLAVASGGYALACAMRAIGVAPGTQVLTNAFTLAPVPGAVASLGAQPIFVGVTENLVIDLDDLTDKIAQTDAKVLLLSHMRGHLCDMDALMAICDANGVQVIEDCAHTMGATANGKPSGRHGIIACYSTQTYKHLNSGEGGLIIGDDPEVMARAILLSGSYMLYERHGAAPDTAYFDQLKYDTPNVSGRMDHLRAAILRPQLATLDDRAKRWNERYGRVERGLANTPGLTTLDREPGYVASSIQFLLLDWPDDKLNAVIDRCAKRGVELKWFGGAEPNGFTSRYDSWHYAPSAPMPKSDRILRAIVDMRLPLTFSLEDCDQLARIIRAEVSAVYQNL